MIVIGAGAAGLVAAGAAAGCGARVLLLEKMERPARKLRITGKGRCNITNLRPHDDFMGHIKAGREFLGPSFAAMDNMATARFFNDIGLETTAERGERLFPASGKAADVAAALENWCRRSGAEIRCNAPVKGIAMATGRAYGVDMRDGRRITAGSIIICTGGVSYPATGSTGDGHRMAHDAGHRIEPLRPSLVALTSGHRAVKRLEGLTLKNINARLVVDGRIEAEEFGEMEFTRPRSGNGPVEIAGAVTLRLSRMAVDNIIEGRQVELALDLKPALSHEKLSARIRREAEALGPRGHAVDLMRKLLPGPMASAAAEAAGLPPRSAAGPMDAGVPERVASLLKDFRLSVQDYGRMEEAIVTAGGVDTSQVDPHTMASRILNGIYFAGEILDIDADTGGYNLQTAFSTGHAAGMAAAKTALKG